MRRGDIENLEKVLEAQRETIQACQLTLGDLMDTPLTGEVTEMVCLVDNVNSSAAVWARAIERMIDATPPF